MERRSAAVDAPEPASSRVGKDADDLPADLLSAALAGDERQWRRLVDRYTPFLRNIVAGYRVGEEGADVVQSTFVSLFEHGDRIRNPDALASWLATTARNECLKVLRSRRRVSLVALTDGSAELVATGSEPPEDRVVRLEEHAVLRGLLAALPPRQRNVLSLLSESDRPDYRRIGRTLGVPTGSIGPTRRRGLDRLRQALDTTYAPICA